MWFHQPKMSITPKTAYDLKDLSPKAAKIKEKELLTL